MLPHHSCYLRSSGFGYCGAGEAASWVQGGRIALGGRLPVNTSGGLLSEAHVGGWNSICEMVRQLRGTAGPSQIADAAVLQWGTAWGDSVILPRGRIANEQSQSTASTDRSRQ